MVDIDVETLERGKHENPKSAILSTLMEEIFKKEDRWIELK